jgi:predicted dehydrogenase
MQLGKHVYVQKPIAHDLYEARILTQAAKKYKVVTKWEIRVPLMMAPES